MWRRTVFAQFECEPLKEAILVWASGHQYNVVFGESNSPDLVAIGAFVSIIDRGLVGQENYDLYLEVIREGEVEAESRDESICIIVDDIRTLDTPFLDVVIRVKLERPYAIEWIIEFLNLACIFVSD